MWALESLSTWNCRPNMSTEPKMCQDHELHTLQFRVSTVSDRLILWRGVTYQTSSSQPWAMSSSSVPGDHLVRNETQERKEKMSQPLTLKLVLAHVDVGRRVDDGRLEVKDHFDWE